jgi:DNA adenine methylase
MSPGHPRFSKSAIEYLRTLQISNLSVSYGDFHNTIPKFTDIFLYLDPPYLISNMLYGKNGNAHKDFDHNGLNIMLKKRKKWVLSYNDCQEIRILYKDFRVLKPQWKYGMSTNKNSRELLILSDDIPDLIETKNFQQQPLF